MKNPTLAIWILIFCAACQSDASLKRKFTGTYQVNLKITANVEKAQEDIQQDFRENAGLAEHIEGFAQDVGEITEKLAELGSSLSQLLNKLGQGLLSKLSGQIEFKSDGTVHIGKKGKFKISSETVRWDIREGRFHLWEEGEEPLTFDLKKDGDKGWWLQSEKLVFQLKRI